MTERVHENLGSWVLCRKLEDKGLKNNYEDETQNKQTFPKIPEELEPMPEEEDQYLGANVLLPREDQWSRGHVVAWSCAANGNVMGRAHANPILDTRLCQVQFTGGKAI